MTTHPRAIRPVRLADRAVDKRVIRGIYAFTLLYPVSFFVSIGLLHLDIARIDFDVSILETVSAVAATLGNVGSGSSVVGPMGSYLDFPNGSKLYMVLPTWVGGLETLPVLVIFTPEHWRR